MDHGLDSLWENDMLESVPVAPGEQSLCEQAVAAARALRALELSHKRKQSGSALPVAVGWRFGGGVCTVNQFKTHTVTRR